MSLIQQCIVSVCFIAGMSFSLAGADPVTARAFSDKVRDLWVNRHYAQLKEYVESTVRQRPRWAPALVADTFVLGVYYDRAEESLGIMRNIERSLLATDAVEVLKFKGILGMNIFNLQEAIRLVGPKPMDEQSRAARTDPSRIRDMEPNGEDETLLLLAACPDVELPAGWDVADTDTSVAPNLVRGQDDGGGTISPSSTVARKPDEHAALSEKDAHTTGRYLVVLAIIVASVCGGILFFRKRCHSANDSRRQG